MEKIIFNTKYLPSKRIVYINFSNILYSFVNEIYHLNKYNFKYIYDEYILLLRVLDDDNIEKYYKVNKYFVDLFIELYKNYSFYHNVLKVAFIDNGIIPKNEYSNNVIKKTLKIITYKKYKYTIYLCFFKEIICIFSNNIYNINDIIFYIKNHKYGDIKHINKTYKETYIIYKKLIK